MIGWIKSHRLPVQVAALIGVFVSSFGLYASLQVRQGGLALALFAVLVLSMMLTALAG